MEQCACCSLGSLLTSAAMGTEAVAASSRGIVLVETVALVTVSVLVSQFATQVFADLLLEEGFDATALGAASTAEGAADSDGGDADGGGTMDRIGGAGGDRSTGATDADSEGGGSGIGLYQIIDRTRTLPREWETDEPEDPGGRL